MSDDPFADLPEADRTVIRPRPGGRPLGAARQASMGGAAAPANAAPHGLGRTLPLVGINPLVRAAAPLLAAIIRLRGRVQHLDPDGLRRNMADAVRDFEQNALQTGLDTKSLRAARYALCATVDDLVLSTPWGSHSAWTAQSLTSLFHNEVSGGERFFDILGQMEAELGRYSEVAELMFLCLSLGFEGRYRVMPRGAAALAEFRSNLFRTLRQRRPEFERELSPHWHGVGTGRNPLRRRVPAWMIAGGAVALAALIYLGFDLMLATASDLTFAKLASLPPTGPVMIARVSAAPAPPPPAAAPAAATSTAARLRGFLAPEIAQGLVEVLEDPQSITIRIANRNMFGSGAATLNSGYGPLLDRIGAALQDEPGKVLVIGHTDDQPIRTARFPSNWQLSTARAETVAQAIKAKLSDPGRVRAEGHADTEPVAPNTTPEGRQRNRRTDIVLIKPPAPP